MSVIIQKFGGKLLETPAKIRRAAELIVETKARRGDPVVVVSAPGKMTDRFVAMAQEITPHPDEREMDMLLSVGERIAMSLLAMAINAQGRYRAVSFTGSQVGIITDTRHTNARIIEVKGYRLKEALERGEIPIVAGFQGVSTEKEITTLGRGGSDATAVALATALKAERCELIKECGSVRSADPSLVPETVPIPAMDYQTLESLSVSGAKIVQPAAAALARENKVTLAVIDISGTAGTVITDQPTQMGSVAALVIEVDLALVEDGDRGRLKGAVPWVLFSEHSAKRLMVVKGKTEALSKGNVVMITIVGWGGSLDWEAIGKTESVLRTHRIRPIAKLGHKDRMTYLLPARIGVRVLKTLHQSLLEAGMIHRNSQPGQEGYF